MCGSFFLNFSFSTLDEHSCYATAKLKTKNKNQRLESKKTILVLHANVKVVTLLPNRDWFRSFKFRLGTFRNCSEQNEFLKLLSLLVGTSLYSSKEKENLRHQADDCLESF